MTSSLAIVTAELDALFAPFDRSDSPGVAVGVAHRGIPVYRRGFGLANVELPVALTPQTRMRIGSTTKHFCCLLLMLLAEEGKLSPEDPVRLHIPELGAWAEGITLERLMHHTAGSRCALDLLGLVGNVLNPGGEISLIEIMLRQTEANFAPGEEFSYSNGGYSLLNEVVQRVGGQSFEALLKERILTPVGMHDTLGRALDTPCVPNSAANHLPDPKGGWTKGIQGFVGHGEGNIASTVDDMLRWLKHLSMPIVGSAETWSRMRTPGRLNSGNSTGYGFGLMTGAYRGAPILHHSGGVMGGACQMLKVLDHELDIVIMTNMAGPASPTALANEIIDRCMAGLAAPEPPSGDATPVSGEFFSARTTRYLALAADDGRQAIQMGPMKLPLLHHADGTFRSPLMPDLKLHVSESEVGWEQYASVDPMGRLGAAFPDENAAIAGDYEVPDIGGTATVVTGSETLLRFDSRYGSTEYRLQQRGPGLWICASTQPMNPASGLPLERAGDDLLLSSGRTRRLRLKRIR